MIEFNNSEHLNEWCKNNKNNGLRIGFVPTMGALHDGHLSLISIAKANNDIVICSIFVNPTQFNEKEDYDKYPVSIKKDKDLLFHEGCDVVFIPNVEAIYPTSKDYNLDIDLGEMAMVLEGKHRPGHFEGVMQVVKRLLEIVVPTVLYLGKKDYQQYSILKKMVGYYQMGIEVAQCPIVREPTGLAMSSRNRRLTEKEGKAALLLSKSLFEIRNNWKLNNPQSLKNQYLEVLSSDPLIEVEYLEIIDAASLMEIKNWTDTESAIACVAAKVGKIRLIDNVTIY